MSEANKALIRQIFEEAVNKGNLNVLDESLSPDYVYREPTVGERHGIAGSREVITMYHKAFPDLKLTIDEQIAEADMVVTRWTGTGTHRGDLFGIPPTGRTVRVQGVLATRIANGKVVEGNELYDGLGMLRQLGVLPASTATAA